MFFKELYLYPFIVSKDLNGVYMKLHIVTHTIANIVYTQHTDDVSTSDKIKCLNVRVRSIN